MRLLRKMLTSALSKLFNTGPRFQNICYSQEGEDLILSRYFNGKKDGFYVDVGAHHPRRFSNTCKFYEMGWHGINIDPIPGMKKSFDKARPRDINLELGIAAKEDELIYNIFDEPALNTFDIEEVKKKDGFYGFKKTGEIKIKTDTLSSVLDKYVPENQSIDFMSVDVEGLDLDVLRSNNWDKYHPKVIVVEELWTDINQVISKSEIYDFLREKGYGLQSKLYNSCIYQRIN